MDNIKMNSQLGKKWFVFYAKVRPWFICFTALSSILDFVKYMDVYFGNWWMLLSIGLTLAAVVLSIMVFGKSKGDYVEFVDFVKNVLIFEVFSISYQQAVQNYINSGFNLGSASLMFIIFFALSYFIWYRLNIKYFKKRIKVEPPAAKNEEPIYDTTATRYCTQCGNKIAVDSNFCGNCGCQIAKK